ncbi:MAG: hypothetical protein ACP5QO_14095, partial [Clostridia bacterium]
VAARRPVTGYGAGAPGEGLAAPGHCLAREFNHRRPSSNHAVGRREGISLADPFRYMSQTQLEYRRGLRHAYLGEVPTPVVYGVQGALREFYGAGDGPPVASTLDHIVAAVGG